jgi:hypothetical protein
MCDQLTKRITASERLQPTLPEPLHRLPRWQQQLNQ